MESVIWEHSILPAKEKFKTSVSKGKVMATVFWEIHCRILGFCHGSNASFHLLGYYMVQGGLKLSEVLKLTLNFSSCMVWW
jgi:hypothetical protein